MPPTVVCSLLAKDNPGGTAFRQLGSCSATASPCLGDEQPVFLMAHMGKLGWPNASPIHLDFKGDGHW